ncbi:MAG: RluA family pseudouridine synthase [Bacteroidia bacterium]
MLLPILYQDKQIIVVNKPAGLMVEPDTHGNPCVLHLLSELLQTQEGRKPAFLQNVHRLDRSVSGVLLFARKASALKLLNAQFAERKVRKVYRAWTNSAPAKPKATLQHWHSRAERQKKALIFGKEGGDRQIVKLKYTILQEKEGLFEWEIELLTGKFHQIRAQLAHIGCPILGDTLYGSPMPYQPNAIALQAYSLSFFHPVSGEKMVMLSNG